MSHELRNFEEGFREGKIVGLKIAYDELIRLNDKNRGNWNDEEVNRFGFGLGLMLRELIEE